MYFNVNFNVFFKLIKVHLLVSELYIYQNARCNDKHFLKNNFKIYTKIDNKTAATCFDAVTPSSGSTLLVLAKVTLVKIAKHI